VYLESPGPQLGLFCHTTHTPLPGLPAVNHVRRKFISRP
jgi:hypothetical protein